MSISPFFALTLGLTLAGTATAADVVGTWQGSAPFPDALVAVTLTFVQSDGQLSGTVKTSEWGEFPLSALQQQDDVLTFRVETDGGPYRQRGKVDKNRIEIVSTMPDGHEVAFTVRRTPAPLAGRWFTNVDGPGGGPMDLVFTFALEDGKVTGTVAGPWGESAFVDARLEGKMVSFTTRFEGVEIVHTGRVDGDLIVLQVRSPQWEFPMTLRREEKPAAL